MPWTQDVDLSREGAIGAILAIVAGEQNAALGRPGCFALAEATVEDVMALTDRQELSR